MARLSVFSRILIGLTVPALMTLPPGLVANAAGTTFVVTQTGGIGVSLRDAPREGARTGVGPSEGEIVTSVCQILDGDPMGSFENRVWHFVQSAHGDTWIPDTYLNTPNVANEATPGVPLCGMSSTAPAFITDGTAAPLDRNAAASWALANAEVEQPFPAACTWFVSNALWAGGLQRTTAWTDEGPERGVLQRRPGTPTATAVAGLVDYLRGAYPASTYNDIGFADNAVPDAQVGDIIAYDWEGDKTLDHLAFVVAIADGNYPEVAEWGTNDTRNPFGSGGIGKYAKRGWTFSEKNHEWLQVGSPNVKAFLLHLDTTTVTTY